MFAQRKWAVGLALTMGFTLLASPEAAPAPTPSPASCDVAALVAERVAELGETGRSSWTVVQGRIVDGSRSLLGAAGVDEVQISSEVPCDLVSTVVSHEWMHLQQERRYPGRAGEAYGAKGLERIADCGAQLMGGHYAPYLEKIYPGPCSEYELQSARSLIKNDWSQSS